MVVGAEVGYWCERRTNNTNGRNAAMHRIGTALLTLALLGTGALALGGGPARADLVEPPFRLAQPGMSVEAVGWSSGPPAAPLADFDYAAAATEAAATARVNDLLVFGDSYSQLNRSSFPNWAEQLKSQGKVGRLVGYAKSGALAAKIGGNTFDRQIRLWRGDGGDVGSGDVAVVYLGYNDIDNFGSQTSSRAGLEAGIKALVAGGATTGGSRLLIVQPHDVGSTPKRNGSASSRSTYRQRTVSWNRFLGGIARKYDATLVNVAGAIDRVLENPAAAGFTNVTTADPGRSRTTALYHDSFHFGQAGHAVVARTVAGRLGSGSAASVVAAAGGSGLWAAEEATTTITTLATAMTRSPVALALAR